MRYVVEEEFKVWPPEAVDDAIERAFYRLLPSGSVVLRTADYEPGKGALKVTPEQVHDILLRDGEVTLTAEAYPPAYREVVRVVEHELFDRQASEARESIQEHLKRSGLLGMGGKSVSEYWDTVRTIAEEIREAYPNPRRHHNERVDRVHEDVDGNSYIIYYAENEDVLRETHNEPDPRDVRAMSAPDADWKQMRTIAAYLAMEADVFEVLQELDEAAEDEEESED